uniref:Nucleosome assembly protein 1-like 1 n=2 Tax=Cacopsylla melanoneura TaxID=428564 RepID=A0A8D8TZ67_9HEMI
MADNKEKIVNQVDKDVDDMDDEEVDRNIAQEVLKRPDILAYLQDQYAARDYIRSLPAPVKKRVKALKKLQSESIKIEAKFYEDVHKLECQYHSKYFPLYDKRDAIVNGTYEPADDECDWPSDEEEDYELSKELKEKVKLEAGGNGKTKEQKLEDEKVAGIPGFWLTVFHNVSMLSEMVQVYDEPILKHLLDVRVIILEKDPMGFVLEFHFSKNPYFTNTLLTKEYVMKCEPDENEPFSFEGPEIYKCVGCKIDWNKDQNVTVKTVKKRQKHKSKAQIRVVNKIEPNDSFFNFFNPPAVPEDPNAEIDEETQALLSSDFEIGHYIRERIIPRAVLYFTGEAMDDDDELEEEMEEEEDDDDDDECDSFSFFLKHYHTTFWVFCKEEINTNKITCEINAI